MAKRDKELFLPKKIQDIIAEWSEACSVPYSEAQEDVIDFFKNEAKKKCAPLQMTLDAYGNMGEKAFDTFIEIIRDPKRPK